MYAKVSEHISRSPLCGDVPSPRLHCSKRGKPEDAADNTVVHHLSPSLLTWAHLPADECGHKRSMQHVPDNFHFSSFRFFPLRGVSSPDANCNPQTDIHPPSALTRTKHPLLDMVVDASPPKRNYSRLLLKSQLECNLS